MRMLCVTGMHRSGTSLVARVLNLLGVDLGPPERLMQPSDDNPLGFWEHRDITAFNDDLLASLGGWWLQPPVLADGWETEPGLDPFRERARELVGPLLERGSDVVGWKDPRLSLLLPFWRTVVDIHRTVLCVRDPREVADSLARRNRLDAPASAWLWLRYTVSAWRHDPDALVVSYEDLLDDDRLRGVLAIADELGLPAPDASARRSIADFIRPELRHHRAADGPPPDPITGLALRCRDLLRQRQEVEAVMHTLHDAFAAHTELARSHRELELAKFTEVWRELAACREQVVSLRTAQDQAVQQRDSAVASTEVLASERDQVVRQRDDAIRQRDATVRQREESHALLAEAARQREAVMQQRDEAEAARDGLRERVAALEDVQRQAVELRDRLAEVQAEREELSRRLQEADRILWSPPAAVTRAAKLVWWRLRSRDRAR